MGGANPEVLHEEGCSGSARAGGEWGVVMVMVDAVRRGWRWLIGERCLWGRGDDWLASAIPRGCGAV